MNSVKIKYILYLALTLLAGLGLSACFHPDDSAEYQLLRIAVQPVQEQEDFQKAYLPLISYLEKELGVDIEWVPLSDYQEQLDKFHEQKIDLTLFGGYAFVQAYEQDQADPLVMRDVDFQFRSDFIVAADNNAAKVSELQDQSFSFGSALSTSGHLMPRFFLSTQGIMPEEFFSEVRYSGKHDLTVKWVAEGQVEVGVVDTTILEKMLRDKHVSKSQIKVIWTTPPYPNYVWAARKKLPEALKQHIIEAFIKLAPEDRQQRKLLELVGAHHYLPAKVADFQPIRKIAKQLAGSLGASQAK
ncbi:MAG: phosphate/phosphite/phosphonate ABC transporter substrate-binding protein [Methyloprofundus sp.]|nr:phosphate/phosphite/phosphonate ABC transporter substrate-binding protein [Methyloprofundus sp.]